MAIIVGKWSLCLTSWMQVQFFKFSEERLITFICKSLLSVLFLGLDTITLKSTLTHITFSP